jgi:hypothetical protein
MSELKRNLTGISVVVFLIFSLGACDLSSLLAPDGGGDSVP